MVSQLNTLIADTVEREFGHKLSTRSGLVSYADAAHGDFTTNVAFRLAKELKMAPAAIASQLAGALQHPSLESAQEAAGYVNIVMDDSFWAAELAKVDANYGSSDIGGGKKVQVEFVSANPTGPLTLGNGRGGYTGDVLANVLSATGNIVEREYYLNDTGNQVKALKNSIYAWVSEKLGLPHMRDIQNVYQGSYIAEIGETIADKLVSEHDGYADWSLAQYEGYVENYFNQFDVLGQMISGIQASTAKMGITFDRWFSEEQELHVPGEVAAILVKLQKAGLTEDKDGAVWLKGGEDRDRVLVKSDGSYTYLLVDIAYHWNKLSVRKFDKVINLWGADHAGQVPSLKGALKTLDLDDRLDVLLFQLVRLIRDGQEYKVSKRAGTYVTIDELIELTGSSDVTRFFFLMRSADTQMEFDLDLAQEQSQKNPYWYVMYSYARANSILAQAAAKGLKPGKEINVLKAQERTLIKQISQFSNLLESMASDYGVHRLTFYGMEVARMFHDFYEAEKIIGLEPAKAAEKLYLIQQYIQFMKVYFSVLGITPIEKM